MGTTYFGPYYEEIDTYDHEHYAARVMPDGTETGTFGGEYGWDRHIDYRARCEFGWAGAVVYPVPDPDQWDSDEADQEWMREHIQPMVDQARRDTWPAWPRREADRAASAANAIAAGRYTDALETMQRMRDDLAARMRTVGRPQRHGELTTTRRPRCLGLRSEQRGRAFPGAAGSARMIA